MFIPHNYWDYQKALKSHLLSIHWIEDLTKFLLDDMFTAIFVSCVENSIHMVEEPLVSAQLSSLVFFYSLMKAMVGSLEMGNLKYFSENHEENLIIPGLIKVFAMLLGGQTHTSTFREGFRTICREFCLSPDCLYFYNK